ncbi:MAG TPA: ATP-binding protein [bacterium]
MLEEKKKIAKRDLDGGSDEMAELRARLEEAEETLRAIREGEVDAVIMSGARGDQVYTLMGADAPYRVILQTMSEGACTLDAAGTVMYCNRRLAEMLKLPIEQVIGSDVFRHIPQQDRGSFGAFLSQAGNQAVHHEASLRLAGGDTLPVLLSASPLALDGTRHVCVIVTDLTQRKQIEEELRCARDELELRVAERTAELTETNFRLEQEIQERTQVEEELRQSEDELRRSEHNLIQAQRIGHTGSWEWDVRTSDVLASEEFHRLFGMGKEAALSLPTLLARVHPEDMDLATSMLEKVRAGLPRVNVDIRLPLPDGAVRILNVEGEVTDADAAGKPRCMAGTVQDVTERKRAEDQIRRYNEELERQVAERTAHIQKLERLRVEAEKQAAIGRMAARIAHEINNPLAGIKNSFLLVKKAIPPTFKHYEFVGRIDKELDRIARIVRQMFEVYKPQRNAPALFSVSDAVRDVVALLHGNAHAKHVTLEIGAEAASAVVYLHEDSVRQVLFSIIQNAIEASPEGGTVRIGAELQDHMLKLDIVDQGCGIPPEVGARIFEPFFTTKNELASGGLGLGLSITNGVVEAMGGHLSYESAVGKGTAFKVTLPLNHTNKEVQ